MGYWAIYLHVGVRRW